MSPQNSDGESVRIAASALDVDVGRFLTIADQALQQHREDGHAAGPLLATAEAMYTGDVLEDDPYSDWHVPLREEARAQYLAVARALAGEHVDAAGGPRLRQLAIHQRGQRLFVLFAHALDQPILRAMAPTVG